MAYTHKIKVYVDTKEIYTEEYKKWKQFIVDLSIKNFRFSFNPDDLVCGQMPVLKKDFKIIEVERIETKMDIILKVTFKTEEDFMMFKLKML